MTQELSPGAVPEPEYVPTQPEEYRDNLSVRLICYYCKEDPPNLIEDFQSGDTLCESCGVVIAARGIDTRAEWRTFANDDQNTDDPSRVGDGPNPLLNGSQLQTSIAFGDSMRSKELHRAQNKASNDKNNKVLMQGFKQINAYCEAYHMPTIVSDGAKHIFKDVDDSKDFKGKSQEAIIAGCIFIACRRNGVPRSFQEIHHLTKVSKKEIGRTFKLLEKFLIAQDRNKKNKPQMHANGKSRVTSCHTCRVRVLTVCHKVSWVSTRRLSLPQPAPLPSCVRAFAVCLVWIRSASTWPSILRTA